MPTAKEKFPRPPPLAGTLASGPDCARCARPRVLALGIRSKHGHGRPRAPRKANDSTGKCHSKQPRESLPISRCLTSSATDPPMHDRVGAPRVLRCGLRPSDVLRTSRDGCNRCKVDVLIWYVRCAFGGVCAHVPWWGEVFFAHRSCALASPRVAACPGSRQREWGACGCAVLCLRADVCFDPDSC